jgi:hypothetical protein
MILLPWPDIDARLSGELRTLFLLLSERFPQFSGENIALLGGPGAIVVSMRWTVPVVSQEYWEKVMSRAPLPFVCSVLFTSGNVQLDFDRTEISSMGLRHTDWRIVIENWWGG